MILCGRKHTNEVTSMEEKMTKFLFALNRINTKLKEISDELNAITTEMIKEDFDDIDTNQIDMLSTEDFE